MGHLNMKNLFSTILVVVSVLGLHAFRQYFSNQTNHRVNQICQLIYRRSCTIFEIRSDDTYKDPSRIITIDDIGNKSLSSSSRCSSDAASSRQ
ncbi:hypothetical protein EON63_10730 [archaeon]|nr:MAG: hypothetical protein EON63_10730 [archaeon]